MPPRLDAEIRDFIKQEVNHTRKHAAFNRAAAADIPGVAALFHAPLPPVAAR